MRRDYLLRRDIVFAPLFERSERIEHIRTSSAPAVTHSWHHKEPQEILRLLHAPQFGYYTLVIIDAVERRDELIGPSVIHDQFSAVRFERCEVWIYGIHNGL